MVQGLATDSLQIRYRKIMMIAEYHLELPEYLLVANYLEIVLIRFFDAVAFSEQFLYFCGNNIGIFRVLNLHGERLYGILAAHRLAGEQT